MADIVLTFQGKEYRLPETRAFEAGEAVEDIATLFEVTSWRQRPNFHKMARCFSALLELAGHRVTAQDVYREMMGGYTKSDFTTYFGALTTLVAVLMHGAPEPEEGAGASDEGKQEAAS